MAFQNLYNTSRVEKIVSIVALIETSANSNAATSEEIWELLSPALDALSALCGAETSAPTEAPVAAPVATTKAHPWHTVKQMAEEADLKDLTLAMAVYLNRIDDLLSSKKGTNK